MRLLVAACAVAAGCSSGGGGGDPAPKPDPDDTARRLAAQQDAVLVDPHKHWYDLPPDAASMFAGMPDCERYMTAIEAYAQCDKLPASSRDSMAGMVKSLRDSWTGIRDPDMQRSTNDACKTGIESFRQAIAAMGCSIPP